MDLPVENLSPGFALNPVVAIPAAGRYLCQLAPAVMTVPGDHAVNLAAAYQSADYVVRRDHGVPPEVRVYAAGCGVTLTSTGRPAARSVPAAGAC